MRTPGQDMYRRKWALRAPNSRSACSASWDHVEALSSADSVDVEVGVEAEHLATLLFFCGGNQCGIGEVHGPVGVCSCAGDGSRLGTYVITWSARTIGSVGEQGLGTVVQTTLVTSRACQHSSFGAAMAR